MLSCPIIRVALTYYPWQVFRLHSEGCIGVTMSSVTINHSTLIGSVTEVPNSLKTFIAFEEIVIVVALLIRGNVR